MLEKFFVYFVVSAMAAVQIVALFIAGCVLRAALEIVYK